MTHDEVSATAAYAFTADADDIKKILPTLLGNPLVVVSLIGDQDCRSEFRLLARPTMPRIRTDGLRL